MRILSVALLLALAAPAAHAQLVPSIDLGIAGGVNFASLGDAANVDLGSSTGYHIGAYADVGVLFFAARTGVYYLRAGDIDTDGNENTDGQTVSFITVPVDFQFQTPTPFVKAYALVGPEFRFPLGDFDELGGTFDRSNVNTVANVGLGVKGGLPLFGPSGFLELRYSFDVTGINSADGDDDFKVSLFLIRAGVGI